MLHKERPGSCERESCRDSLLDGRPWNEGLEALIRQREGRLFRHQGSVFMKDVVLVNLPKVTKGQGWVLGPV